MKASRLALLLVALVLAPAAAAQPAIPEKPTPSGTTFREGPLTIDIGVPTGGSAVAFHHVALPMMIVLDNPTEDRIAGEIELEPVGDAVVNLTRLAYDIEPGAYAAWTVLLTLRSGDGGLRASAPELDASVTAALAGEPALSVVVTDPTQRAHVGARELTALRVNVTNHGPAPVAERLVALVRDEVAAAAHLDPPLAPNETRVVEFRAPAIPLPPQPPGRAQTTFYVPWVVARDAGDGPPRPTFTLEVQDGRLSGARIAAGDFHLTVGPSVRVVSEGIALGRLSAVVAHLRHDGDEPVEVTLRIEASSPFLAMDPRWRIEPHVESFLLRPGVQREVRYAFTPRVSGPLEVNAYLLGEDLHVRDGTQVQLASPVRADVGNRSWSSTIDLRASARWTLNVSTDEPLADARFRVALAPRHSGTYDGPIAREDLLRLSAGGDALGAFEPGANRSVTVDVVGRASGGYVLLPYVESGGLAYLATPEGAGWGVPPGGRAHARQQPAVEVVMLGVDVMPASLPAGVAFVPAGVLLVGSAALWIGRRAVVR